MDPAASDFRSTEFGKTFVSAFENAKQAASKPEDIFKTEEAPQAADEKPAEEPAQNFDVIETPAKKAASIFDDPEEDESDVLPIFKGRNIFSNN